MFYSTYKKLGYIQLPTFNGTRIMMMPLILGNLNTLPSFLNKWETVIKDLFEHTNKELYGKVGYLTIDEKKVKKGETHRRKGLHVDGVFKNKAGGWGGGNDGAWGSKTHGMITISSHAGCKAWNQEIYGYPGPDGECDHLINQLDSEKCEIFEPNMAYHVSGMCVHESLPMEKETERQFVRLSMPSNAPWFEGYTENPLGIKPSGEILPRRKYMNEN